MDNFIEYESTLRNIKRYWGTKFSPHLSPSTNNSLEINLFSNGVLPASKTAALQLYLLDLPSLDFPRSQESPDDRLLFSLHAKPFDFSPWWKIFFSQNLFIVQGWFSRRGKGMEKLKKVLTSLLLRRSGHWLGETKLSHRKDVSKVISVSHS